MGNAQKRMQLLIVDDTPANIRILNDALRDEYDIAVALSGKQALEIVADVAPDLILLDIMMPEMDGYEVCQRLKESQDTSKIPVIFVTAMSEVSDETKGLELGASDYITKPFNIDIVRARVRTHLSLAEARSTLERQNKELIDASRLKEDVERITRHDLKNPLTTILSVPQLLLMAGNLEEHQRDMLGRVEDAGYDMLRQINFSLDLFKMEQGSYSLDLEDVDLAALTRRVFRELEEPAGMQGVNLSLEVDNEGDDGRVAFMVQGEELLCHSMLGNLIRNAVEAQSGGGDVTVSLWRDAKGVSIAVRNPALVPGEIHGTFFEKYVTQGKNRGTGLGTYSAKLTAHTLGGSIGMESTGHAGTIVTVVLPADKA